MKRVEQYMLPTVFLIIGGVIMYQSLFRLAYFDARRGAPGPGFLAFWLSVGLIAVSIGIIVNAVRYPAVQPPSAALADDPILAELEREAELDEGWPARLGWQRIAYLMVPLVAVLLVFERVGFLVSTALYLMAAGYGLGIRRLPVLIPAAVAASAALYLLFSTWLGVKLPDGLLSF
jgi:putative tricarboxylic transport membrane protein